MIGGWGFINPGIYPAYDANEGFKAIVHIKIPDVNRLIGIIVHLSFIGSQIGFYYSDSKTELNLNPIRTPVKDLTYGRPGDDRPNPEVSYHPINDLHLTYKPILMGIVKTFFPDFVEFDNRYADVKINGIQTELGYYREIGLFQLFFGTSIDGVI